MKIQVNGKTLNEILKKVKTFIDLKIKYVPLLKTIKITASDMVYITATDLVNTIIVKVPGSQVLEQGEVCINYKELQQMIKGQTEQIIITNDTIENGMIINYQSIDAEDYPKSQRITPEEQQYNTTLSNDFIKGVDTCIPYILEKESNPALQGVWIDGKNIFGCDTITMALYKQDEIQYPKNILIFNNSAKCIASTFKKENNIQCKITDSLIELSNGEYTVVCRTNTELTIPNYNAIVDGLKGEDYITVDTKYFKLIGDKFPKDKKATLVDLKITNGIVQINTDIVKPFEVKCKDVRSNDLEMCYNNMYMQRLLNSFNLKENEELRINFNGRTGPFTIQNDKLLVLSMPVLNKKRAMSV